MIFPMMLFIAFIWGFFLCLQKVILDLPIAQSSEYLSHIFVKDPSLYDKNLYFFDKYNCQKEKNLLQCI